MTDHLIEYEIFGERHTTIWEGYSRVTAIEDFKIAYPGRKVIEGKVQP